MKRFVFLLALAFAASGCNRSRPRPVTGPFSREELQQFTALNPIDAHTHVFIAPPDFHAVMNKLNLHLLDILVVDDTNESRNDVAKESAQAWEFARENKGRVSICTTFDPYQFNQPGFAQAAIRQINQEFDQGAVAVKIWKNIGMELKDASGNYILPDDPLFEPIYQDIAAHNKTLVAHVADPGGSWEPPNLDSPSHQYFEDNPQWYMYGKPHSASKEQILRARDNLLEQNPNLRVVGAHLGSMEENFTQLAEHFDSYPNFAVDLAGRMSYIMLQPRSEMIAFIISYQDRLIYGTDLERGFGEIDVPGQDSKLEENYAINWRFLATNDALSFRGHTVQGLALPHSVVSKLYHDNAVRWFRGILANSH